MQLPGLLELAAPWSIIGVAPHRGKSTNYCFSVEIWNVLWKVMFPQQLKLSVLGDVLVNQHLCCVWRAHPSPQGW